MYRIDLVEEGDEGSGGEIESRAIPSNIFQSVVIIRDVRDCSDDNSVVECYAEDGEDEGNEDDQKLQLCCWHNIVGMSG